MFFCVLLVSAADFDIQRAVRVAARALENSGSHFWPGYFLPSPCVSAANANMNVHEIGNGIMPRQLRREQAAIVQFTLVVTIDQ